MHYRELDRYLQKNTVTCLKRRWTKGGHPYYYKPRTDLLIRLSKLTGEDMESVQNMLFELRDLYLRVYPDVRKHPE